MIRNFDLDALRTMVVGVELGSFTRAASHLGRSQSAISMQVKKLEDRAGTALFQRKGRGLIPTAAGEKLLAYARKIVALNDEALIALGVGEAVSSVRLGLPQDFFDEVLPRTIEDFSSQVQNVHVDVRAGRNFALEEEVHAGRLDAAIAFFPEGSQGHGELLARLPTIWLGGASGCDLGEDKIPLVLFDHPCLFRSTALSAMDREARLWRVALTTPSLPGIWAAVRMGQGVTLRTAYRVPEGITPVPEDEGLPPSDAIEVRLLSAPDRSPVAEALCDALRRATGEALAGLDD